MALDPKVAGQYKKKIVCAKENGSVNETVISLILLIRLCASWKCWYASGSSKCIFCGFNSVNNHECLFLQHMTHLFQHSFYTIIKINGHSSCLRSSSETSLEMIIDPNRALLKQWWLGLLDLRALCIDVMSFSWLSSMCNMANSPRLYDVYSFYSAVEFKL